MSFKVPTAWLFKSQTTPHLIICGPSEVIAEWRPDFLETNVNSHESPGVSAAW